MVVRAIDGTLGEHDGQIVLGVVGVGVFPLAPLADRLAVADAHDGPPVALAAVVGDSAFDAVVTQSERVPDLVAGGLGDVFRAGSGAGGKHPAGDVIGHIERSHVGDAAHVASIPVVATAADADADAISAHRWSWFFSTPRCPDPRW